MEPAVASYPSKRLIHWVPSSVATLHRPAASPPSLGQFTHSWLEDGIHTLRSTGQRHCGPPQAPILPLGYLRCTDALRCDRHKWLSCRMSVKVAPSSICVQPSPKTAGQILALAPAEQSALSFQDRPPSTAHHSRTSRLPIALATDTVWIALSRNALPTNARVVTILSVAWSRGTFMADGSWAPGSCAAMRANPSDASFCRYTTVVSDFSQWCRNTPESS